VHKVQVEAEEEMKRLTDVHLKQQREQKEFIVKLQVWTYFSQSSGD
jgi:hypothetical protein